MPPAEQREALQELTARGLIAAAPAPRRLDGGNSDRRDERSSWHVLLPDGREARLLLARDLAAQAARQAAFHHECPQLVGALFFHVHLRQGEALAEEFLPGSGLSDQTGEIRLPAGKIQIALTGVLHQLALTEQASTEAARQAEWNQWAARLGKLPVFTATDAGLLSGLVLPRLYEALTARTAPASRWSHGDFHAANVRLDASGEARLVDLEFSGRTHFHREDAVRFRILSAVARRHPDWFTALPDPGPAWHLYFWLRQLELEGNANSRNYLAGVVPTRLAVIRRLAETALAASLDGWSVPSLPAWFHLETSQETGGGLEVAGWCHVPSATALRAIAVLAPNGIRLETAPFARPDVAAHFGGEPRALLSGFKLRLPPPAGRDRLLLAAITADGTLLPFHALQSATDGVAADIAPAETAWVRRQRPPPSTWPLLSVVMPVYNPPLPFLERAVASVIAQSYPHWELCLVDDASTAPGLRDRLQAMAAAEPRIRLQTQATNTGISRATNAGLAQVRGGHTAFLDHDDELAPEALAEIAAVLLDRPGTDVIYTDQDKCDAAGARFEPFHKPGWSPVYLLGVMYVGHLLVARTELLRRIGGCNSAFDRIQDYELMLRLSDETRQIVHLPRILYHWRISPGSIALSSDAKGPVDALQVSAVQAHLARNGHRLHAVSHPRIPHRVQLFPATDRDERLVSVVLAHPARERFAATTTHRAYELIDDARAARGEFLLFLHPGLESSTPGWLQILLAHLDLPGIGAVSPLIVGSDGRVEYAGDDALTGHDPAADGPGGRLACSHETPQPASACLLIRRDLLLPGYTGAQAELEKIQALLLGRGLAALYVANAILRRTAGGL